jgi:hypothetical protein
MIKKPPLLPEKPKDDKPNLPIDFGVNYAIVMLYLLFVSMFKPEISALKERIKINKNKNMTKQDPSSNNCKVHE